MFLIDFLKSVHEIIIVLLIVIILLAIHRVSDWFQQEMYNIAYDYGGNGDGGMYDYDTQPPRTDISMKLYYKCIDIAGFMETIIWFLSLFLIPWAVYVTAKNDRLAFAVRLLLPAENVNKFIATLILSLFWFWEHVKIDNKRIPKWLSVAIQFSSDWLIYGIDIRDIAWYCQLMISLNRFFAVSFDGLYYAYAQKWPFFQLVIPYLLKGCLWYFRLLTYDEWMDFWSDDYAIRVPKFFLCGFDFVTWWKIRKLRKAGKASRTEIFLMVQMLANSFVVLVLDILFPYVRGIVILFFGSNVIDLVKTFIDFLNTFFFHFLTTVICILMLSKRDETKVNNKRTTQITFVKESSTKR